MFDLCIMEGVNILGNELDLLSQSIYILLNTEQGSIPYDLNFGVSLYKYVHEFNADEKEIKMHLMNQINQYCLLNNDDYKVQIEISFFKENHTDICLINILINNDYKFGIYV